MTFQRKMQCTLRTIKESLTHSFDYDQTQHNYERTAQSLQRLFPACARGWIQKTFSSKGQPKSSLNSTKQISHNKEMYSRFRRTSFFSGSVLFVPLFLNTTQLHDQKLDCLPSSFISHTASKLKNVSHVTLDGCFLVSCVPATYKKTRANVPFSLHSILCSSLVRRHSGHLSESMTNKPS